MSIFGRRRGQAPPPTEGISFGVAPNTSLPELLSQVADGIITRSVAASALKRDRTERIDLRGLALSETQAGVLEEFLSKSSAVRELALSHVTFQAPAAFARLCNGVAQCSSLRVVAIAHAQLSDAQADKLVSAILMGKSPVNFLDLSYNSLGSPSDALDKLKRNTKLETLNLAGNTILCIDTLAGGIAGHWPALQEVMLARCSVSEADADMLKRAAKSGSERFSDYTSQARCVSM